MLMNPRAVFLSCACFALLAACAGGTVNNARDTPATTAAPVPELKPGIPAGYLGRALPDSLALVPPPPATDSPAFAQDQAIHATAQALRNSPRGTLATSALSTHGQCLRLRAGQDRE
jgi:acid phosphatase (class A)